jgi:hypothetical protein
MMLGCGGTAASPGGSNGSSTPAPTTNTGTPAQPTAPGAVTVTAGQISSGVDIAVSAAQSSPAPNAEDLGVAALTGAGSAYNTGDVIHRGQTARVLLFGPGLSGDMQVSIRGPSDITIASINAITSTTSTPGITFMATVAPNAALGARTVVLQNAKGDITTFTGGLEVLP